MHTGEKNTRWRETHTGKTWRKRKSKEKTHNIKNVMQRIEGNTQYGRKVETCPHVDRKSDVNE
jgi:hypothetical protein